MYTYTKTLAQVSWRQGVQKGRVKQLSAFSVLTEQAICQHLPQMHNNDNFFKIHLRLCATKIKYFAIKENHLIQKVALCYQGKVATVPIQKACLFETGQAHSSTGTYLQL